MALRELKPFLKVFVCMPGPKGEPAFGPGIASLCEGVRETGSLNKAAKQMFMAYSKAWTIIKEAEEGLGVPLLVRNSTNGSRLSPEGELLLNTYRRMEERLERESQKIYQQVLAEEMEKLHS